MMEGSGTLEQQLEATRQKAAEVRARRSDLKKIEDLGQILEEHLILDNRYTEHSTVGLAQQWDQLDQLGMRMQHNLEQQIQARNQSGVSEDALKEFSMMFKHFDKEKCGRLNHAEFKSCLRALGYDLPMIEEGQSDPEFEAILDVVDPNRDGAVSLQEYMAFMISKETENVHSSEEIQNAFRAIAAGDRPYVLREELYQNLTKEMADYCVGRMKPYEDPKTGSTVPGALDYMEFTPTISVCRNAKRKPVCTVGYMLTTLKPRLVLPSGHPSGHYNIVFYIVMEELGQCRHRRSPSKSKPCGMLLRWPQLKWRGRGGDVGFTTELVRGGRVTAYRVVRSCSSRPRNVDSPYL
ncbi:Spectrin alpha chain [Portunus trituberculatus]|uniref:Spectrin alpha chain n=1 Tax=Portunus trituberculatus TaxID=210409 RepID=A0A5B7GDT9_PORTR|nr:Spectrin alpha chain [Portunus trituberculatus]